MPVDQQLKMIDSKHSDVNSIVPLSVYQQHSALKGTPSHHSSKDVQHKLVLNTAPRAVNQEIKHNLEEICLKFKRVKTSSHRTIEEIHKQLHQKEEECARIHFENQRLLKQMQGRYSQKVQKLTKIIKRYEKRIADLQNRLRSCELRLQEHMEGNQKDQAIDRQLGVQSRQLNNELSSNPSVDQNFKQRIQSLRAYYQEIIDDKVKQIAELQANNLHVQTNNSNMNLLQQIGQIAGSDKTKLGNFSSNSSPKYLRVRKADDCKNSLETADTKMVSESEQQTALLLTEFQEFIIRNENLSEENKKFAQQINAKDERIQQLFADFLLLANKHTTMKRVADETISQSCRRIQELQGKIDTVSGTLTKLMRQLDQEFLAYLRSEDSSTIKISEGTFAHLKQQKQNLEKLNFQARCIIQSLKSQVTEKSCAILELEKRVNETPSNVQTSSIQCQTENPQLENDVGRNPHFQGCQHSPSETQPALEQCYYQVLDWFAIQPPRYLSELPSTHRYLWNEVSCFRNGFSTLINRADELQKQKQWMNSSIREMETVLSNFNKIINQQNSKIVRDQAARSSASLSKRRYML